MITIKNSKVTAAQPNATCDKDFGGLKLTVIIGAAFGQFPVKNLKYGLLSLNFSSQLGLWSMLLVVIHLITLQTIFVVSDMQTE